MNINNLTMSQVQQNIIRNTVNACKGSFANMLIDATGNGITSLLGKSENSLLTDDTAQILNRADDMEADEAGKKIDYGNIGGMQGIFLLIPRLFTDDAIAQNISAAASDSQLLYGGVHNDKLLQGDTSFIKQDAVTDKTILGNMMTEKPMPEYVTTKEMFKNVIAEKTVLENESTERTIVENKSAEKATPENNTEEKTVQYNIEHNLPKAPLSYMQAVDNKIIAVTDESTEIKTSVLSQIRDKIIIATENTSGNIKTISMQLQPQNLGKVNIKLIFENNKLTVEIKALKEETQKILSSSTGELKEMLSKGTDVKIVVKPLDAEAHHYQNERGNEQYFYQGYEQNQEQSRQRNNYYYKQTKKTEEDIFSELISSIKFKEDIIGN